MEDPPMIRWFHAILVIIVVFAFTAPFVVPSHAQGLETWNRNCWKSYKKWKTLANHKAFAVSNSSYGGHDSQTCGYSWGAPTKAAAEQSAIKFCEGPKYRPGKCRVTKSE
jgi:hypothetical protein